MESLVLVYPSVLHIVRVVLFAIIVTVSVFLLLYVIELSRRFLSFLFLSFVLLRLHRDVEIEANFPTLRIETEIVVFPLIFQVVLDTWKDRLFSVSVSLVVSVFCSEQRCHLCVFFRDDARC